MVLVIGANGQIGSVLTKALKNRYGAGQVIASDIRVPQQLEGRFVILDITKRNRLEEVVDRFGITQIYHLAAILSAKGETNPIHSWDINMKGLLNVLEVARLHQLEKVFFPSSIAVFGTNTPKELTPQFTLMNPSTVYGISKLAGEQWCQYYFEKYGLDVRSVRYPGVIGHQSLPGGGTTDYAVEIFHAAVQQKTYTCFLKEDTMLPMMYMHDAVQATISIMDAPKSSISIRSSYNIAGMSFTPIQLTQAIQHHFPNFKVNFKPDFRQKIADSWTNSIDDHYARNDWAWKAEYDLKKMTEEMIHHLKINYFNNPKFLKI